LNIHPTGKIIGVFDELVRAWEGVPQGYGYGGMKSDGILFEGAFMPPSLGAVNLSLSTREHKEAMERYDHVASFRLPDLRSEPRLDPLAAERRPDHLLQHPPPRAGPVREGHSLPLRGLFGRRR
jgi:hypothetical protein